MQILTMGFTKKKAEEFFNLIREHQVEMLIDVRLNNQSQLAGFTKGQDLAFFLREICNCQYSHEIQFAPTKDILNHYKKKQIGWEKYEAEYNKLIKERNVLDVIDVPVLKECNDCVQPENVLLDLNTNIEIRAEMTLDEVLKMHPLERKRNILGNDYNYITEARVKTVGYSLIIVEVFNLVISQEENPSGKPKTKARFTYRGIDYENMSVTDDSFYSIRSGTKFDRAILVVSIGTPYNSKYYKFVSKIFR